MPAPTSGLARITIRAPRRRLDLAVPHQVPLAELLPEVLRRAGETTTDPAAGPVVPAGGWILRRGDGASLSGATPLAHQGVRDGDVLYLVPHNLPWPEPDYDDVVEEIADGARQHGRAWDAAATRISCLVAAGLVLLVGLGGLLAAGSPGPTLGLGTAGLTVGLLGAGALLSRALGDGVAGAATAGFALPYAAASGLSLGADPTAGSAVGLLSGLTTGQLLVGSAALLLASVIGGVAVGHGLRVFVAGVIAAGGAGLGAVLGFALTGPGVAAIVIVAVVGGIGLAPLLAVRLGRLPLPVVSAVPEVLAAQRRPTRPEVLAAVIRADEILVGTLLGIAVVAVGSIAVLSATTGVAGPLLAALASTALLLRARLFPSLAARLPLLGGGLVGLALTAGLGLAADLLSPGALLTGVAAVVVLLATAATAHRTRTSPYLARLASIADNVAVLALAPIACAVLDLYHYVRHLAG